MNRRNFIGMGLAAGAMPLFNIGCAGFGTSRARQVASGAKIRLGLIGCGGRMGLHLNYGILNNLCTEEIVCLCDPDPIRRDKARAVVKAHQPQTDVSKIRGYTDYREMLEKEGDALDAVVIATPNHHHATAAILAMKMGLHVYVEKPMALTVEEVRAMHAAAKRYGVVTQVGNHGHSEEGMRRLVEYIAAGQIGQVHDVYCYDDRLNAMRYRPPAARPPTGMDWDSWCGPAPVCDYYASTPDHHGIHPHDWHSWIGYGNGSIGNMGTHIMDAPFWALDLGKTGPESVAAKEVAWGCPGAWAYRDTIDFKYPARGNLPPVTLHWYDGIRDGVPIAVSHMERCYNILKKRSDLNFPPALLEFEKKYNLEKAPLAFMGSVFIGTKGAIWHCFHSSLRFFPKGIGKDFIKNKAGYQANEHVMEFLNAVRENREANTGFDYSIPLAQTVLLGNVAARAGKKKLLWDGTRITNDESANAFLKTTYRTGWELPRA
jgi:predicted dehydrogenase